MTKNEITGIDIRKALLASGMRPSLFDEQAMYNFCIENDIESWEIESQVILGEMSDGEKIINQFRVR